MERSDFLKALHDSSRRIRSFLDRDTNRWLTNIVAIGRHDDTDKQGLKPIDIDRIYELLCYFGLVQEVAKKVSIRAIRGHGRIGYRLPYSPGKKRNFTFVRFSFNARTFDLCNGTALPVPEEPDEHPDVSLQEVTSGAADSDKSVGVPIALWDAKYHGSRGGLSKPDINQMWVWASTFEVKRRIRDEVLENIMPPQFQVSAVVTNAASRPQHRKPLLEMGFSVVLKYLGPDTGEPMDPTRSDHVTVSAST